MRTQEVKKGGGEFERVNLGALFSRGQIGQHVLTEDAERGKEIIVGGQLFWEETDVVAKRGGDAKTVNR